MADVVIWNGNPFSVYAKADQVFVDGALLYDRENPALQPVSDFELGQQLDRKDEPASQADEEVQP